MWLLTVQVSNGTFKRRGLGWRYSSPEHSHVWSNFSSGGELTIEVESNDTSELGDGIEKFWNKGVDILHF